MTKLEKIDEMIREFNSGASEGISEKKLIDAIERVLADEKTFDNEKELSVKCKQGTLKAYIDDDGAGVPAAGIMLIPNGIDVPVDLAYVKEDDKSTDLLAMLYGDVFQEDYTDLAEIKRKDIVKAFDYENSPSLEEALSKAEYHYVGLGSEKDFKRYEVSFKRNIIPERLRELADVTDVAEENNLHFLSYPDDALLVHFKDYGDKGTLVVNLIMPDNRVGYSAEVSLATPYYDIAKEAVRETRSKGNERE